MAELPRYKCHKEVSALKIKAIAKKKDGSLLITPEWEDFKPFRVPAKFVPKHRPGMPKPGWYWVRYSNDYESFSPPEAFEEGYSLIEPPAPAAPAPAPEDQF